ncbi:MAG: hypothetical protein Q7R56_01820 [Nanoarchaeota archaeon]|nr:hypothetical protein [Nanoarchaeota archaeon]
MAFGLFKKIKNIFSTKVVLRKVGTVEKNYNKLQTYASNNLERKIARVTAEVYAKIDKNDPTKEKDSQTYTHIDKNHTPQEIAAANKKLAIRISNILHNHNDQLSRDFSQKLEEIFSHNHYTNLRETLQNYTTPEHFTKPLLRMNLPRRIASAAASIAVAAGIMGTISTPACKTYTTNPEQNKPEETWVLDRGIEKLKRITKLPPPTYTPRPIVTNEPIAPPRPETSLPAPEGYTINAEGYATKEITTKQEIKQPTLLEQPTTNIPLPPTTVPLPAPTLEEKIASWETDVKNWSENEKVTGLKILNHYYTAPGDEWRFDQNYVEKLEAKYGREAITSIRNYLKKDTNIVELADKKPEPTPLPKPTEAITKNNLETKTIPLIQLYGEELDVDYKKIPTATIAPTAPVTIKFKDWKEEVTNKSQLYLKSLQRDIDRGQSVTFDKNLESLKSYCDLTQQYSVKGVEAMGDYLNLKLGRNTITGNLTKQMLDVPTPTTPGAPLPAPVPYLPLNSQVQ